MEEHLHATGPIFHKLDDTIRGHVFDQLPQGLDLEGELEQRIADLGRKASWATIHADLASLTETRGWPTRISVRRRTQRDPQRAYALKRRRRRPAAHRWTSPETRSTSDVVPRAPSRG